MQLSDTYGCHCSCCCQVSKLCKHLLFVQSKSPLSTTWVSVVYVYSMKLCTSLSFMGSLPHEPHVKLFSPFSHLSYHPNFTQEFCHTSLFFWGIFCFSTKWESSIGRCRKIGHHPLDDLARSGYKPYLKYRTLIILLCFWLNIENQI